MSTEQIQEQKTYEEQSKVYMTNNEKFGEVKSNLLCFYRTELKSLTEAEKQLLEAQKNRDIGLIDYYIREISNILDNINNLKCKLVCMRLNNENDLKERNYIMLNFPRLVNETIPNDVPLVFHGNNNIEKVKQIISSGGLSTPKGRGVTYKFFDNQIYVTCKNNIKVSCRYADSSINSFLPYGAIFVFHPKENEFANVLETGDDYESTWWCRKC